MEFNHLKPCSEFFTNFAMAVSELERLTALDGLKKAGKEL